MKVTVQLMGPYRQAAGGAAELTLEVEEPTLGGVFRSLAAKFPEAGRKLLPSPNQIEPALRVVLNDVVIQGARLDLTIRDGDRIAFVPIVGGGGPSRSESPADPQGSDPGRDRPSVWPR